MNTTPLHIVAHDSKKFFERANREGYFNAALELVTKMVSFFRRRGAIFDLRDASQRTPLHIALSNADVVTSNILLDNEADVLAVDDELKTPLHCLVGNQTLLSRHGTGMPPGLWAVFKRLLSPPQGFELCKAVDIQKRTALHHAAQFHGHLPAVTELLKCRSDINARDALGDTPLHYALKLRPNVFIYKLRDMLALLVTKGADPTIANNDEKTPLDILEECNRIYGSSDVNSLRLALVPPNQNSIRQKGGRKSQRTKAVVP